MARVESTLTDKMYLWRCQSDLQRHLSHQANPGFISQGVVTDSHFRWGSGSRRDGRFCGCCRLAGSGVGSMSGGVGSMRGGVRSMRGGVGRMGGGVGSMRGGVGSMRGGVGRMGGGVGRMGGGVGRGLNCCFAKLPWRWHGRRRFGFTFVFSQWQCFELKDRERKNSHFQYSCKKLHPSSRLGDNCGG